jgi:hypothetical protein
MRDRDIIDTERFDGNVFKMLLGAMDRRWDGHSVTSPHANRESYATVK